MSKIRKSCVCNIGLQLQNLWSRSSRPKVFLRKEFWKYAANLQENTYTTHNHTTAWMFTCGFAACFQNTFSWRTPLDGYFWLEKKVKNLNFKKSFLAINSKTVKSQVFLAKISLIWFLSLKSKIVGVELSAVLWIIPS